MKINILLAANYNNYKVSYSAGLLYKKPSKE